MTIIPLKDLTFNTTNIPDDTTPLWDAEVGYAKETTRKIGTNLYKNFLAIDPLCTYIYDDTDPLAGEVTCYAVDGVTVDSTAVICVLDDTIVYNKGTDLYYVFDNTSGTIDNGDGTFTVNFSTQDPVAPVNFTAVTGYRKDVNNPLTSSDIWFDLGRTNKYKMLDQSLGSQTVVDGDMEMSFIISKINSVHLFRLYGSAVTIKVTQIDTSTILYDNTIDLTSKNSGGTFWGYFFNDFTYITKLSTDVPLNFNLLVEITITALEGVSKCGLVGIGKSEILGGTLYGSGTGMIDFSKKETNEFGETYLLERDFKETNNLIVDVLSSQTDSVVGRLQELRATPIIYKGSDYTSTIIYGVYNDWDIVFSTPTTTRLNINLESLT